MKPNKKDTYGLSKYKGIEGFSNYSGYAGYADAELYCRWKELAEKGDASKDWSLNGAQSPFKPAN